MHKSPLNYPGVVLRAGMLQVHCICIVDGNATRGSLTSFISVNWLPLLVVCAMTSASSQPDDLAMSMAAADADALLRPPDSREMVQS
jgi:hypothetical protein